MVYLGLLLGPLGRFAELQNSINTAIAGLERVFQFFDVEPDVPSPTDPVTLPDPVQGGMEIKNVSFQYRADRDWALKKLSLKIEPGEVLALVGPSGHGKSTIVKLLARFYDVNEGEILLDGVDIRKLAEHDLRSAIGLVSQETVIFSGTVGMNIAYGAPYPIRHVEREAILEAAKMAHAWEFIERLPEGLDTPIGERGVRLSAGQRQRIALARLFLRNPPVLLLDEATSALDSVSEQLVQDALEHLMEGRTSVVVAHRLATIRHAHRIAVIRNGEIAELGNHEELLERRGIYAELHQKQILESPIV